MSTPPTPPFAEPPSGRSALPPVWDTGFDTWMELDRNGLEVLEREECLSLLGSVPVGRIGVTIDALPVILPVNYHVHLDEIIIRTAEGTKLMAAMRNAVVALEADHFDTVNHSGWSVLVRGSSRVIDGDEALELTERLPLRPWANAASDQFISITTDVVSGRRVRSWNRPDGHLSFVRLASR